MTRLLRISFDYAIFSLVPIVCWFLLGIFVDSRLMNVFTLTYPLQYVFIMILSIFSTGACVFKEKSKDSNAVMSGLVFGIIVSFIVFGGVALNIDSYIKFMNMDIEVYKIFVVYSVFDLFVSLIFAMIKNKLYFEGKDVLANRYSVIFNLLKVVFFILIILITKNQIVIAIISLVPLYIFTVFLFIVNCDKFQLRFNVLDWLRYDSFEFFNGLMNFLAMLFGFSNLLSFGIEYANAMTFVSLVTDTQWDALSSVVTVAMIDISKDSFNYKVHMKNAYKLLTILIMSSVVMFVLLYGFYDLYLGITMIYFMFNIVGLLLVPLCKIKNCYLQIEWSAVKVTSNGLIGSGVRMILSFLKNPYCTNIGMIGSFIYQVFSVWTMFSRHYQIESDGKLRISGPNAVSIKYRHFL